MRANRLLMATMAAMFVMTVVPQTGSFASSGKGSGRGGTNTVSGSETRVVAKLVPTPGQDPLFEGHAARRTQGTRDEFEARVEVPLNAITPDTEPVLHLNLSNGSAIQCTMEFDRDDSMLDIAEYKVSVRSRNLVTSNRAGSCIPSGIPNVGPQDSTFVMIGPTKVLEGNFVSKR